MRITKDTLHRLDLINPYDVARAGPKPRVFIDYRPQDLSRAGHPARWQVCGIGFKTDPDGHWEDYGHKTFNCFRPSKDKEFMRLEAVAWASEKYGVEEWEKSPYGSYHPLGTMAAAIRRKEAPHA